VVRVLLRRHAAAVLHALVQAASPAGVDRPVPVVVAWLEARCC
jgi:hypothetical protein